MYFEKKRCIAMLLAGGQGSRLHVLTRKTAKPAVPFGGKYRIIDFPLSNCANSGIDTVGVLTQYQPLVLKAITDSADVDFYTSEVPVAADQVGRDLYKPNNISNIADYVIITVGEPDVNNIFFTGEDYAGDPISTGLI